MSVLPDRVLGCIYGQAVGDSLGIPFEFRAASEIAGMSESKCACCGGSGRNTPLIEHPITGKWIRQIHVKARNGCFPDCPECLGTGDFSSYSITDRNVFKTHEHFEAGEYSDDTDQALILLDSWIASGRDLDILDIAKRLKYWLENSGKGSGRTTRNVISHPLFLEHPFTASHAIWEAAGKDSAPNGAVMRSGYVGLFQPAFDIGSDEGAVFNYVSDCARQCALVTHHDLRCVASAVMVSVTISALIRGYTVSSAIAIGQSRAQRYDQGIWDIINPEVTLNSLRLDNGLPRLPGIPYPNIGFTYKTLGAGIWALRALDSAVTRQKAEPVQKSFLSILQGVIRAGGDADTNGAVAGTLMGAFVGAVGIPKQLISGLVEQKALQARAEQLTW